MAVASVGVCLADDFPTLPLFEAPPLDGPTKRIGSLASGVQVRAVEKNADFLLLEADADAAGTGGGTLGWADASCVVPVAFPAVYEFGSELPDAVSLVIRASPQPGAAEAGKIFGKGSLVVATGVKGDYISVAYRDPDDPSAPTVRGWMLTSTDNHVLLTVRPSYLAVPADGLPEGVQLRVRAGADASAAEVKQVSAAPGTIFEVAEQSGDWMRVLLGEEASAWMISSAKGMSLLRPTRRELYVMDPALIAQHGDAVKLAVRASPSANGESLGEIGSRGLVQCVGTRGPWLRVLYQGYKEAWMLSQTPTKMKLLVPAASVGQNASGDSGAGLVARAAEKKGAAVGRAATTTPDGHRYMVCARQVTIRADPEFFAQDLGVAPAGAVVQVLEKKEDVNEAKNTKDTWVRGQLPSADAGAKTGFMVEGWLLAASTKRGAMMTEAPDALAAQNAFQREEAAIQAAATPSPTAATPPPAAAPAPAQASTATAAVVGGFMRAAGTLKLREEADSLSVELGNVSAGELVKVVQTSDLWVRVLYRGNSNGWVLTANKRGPILSPAEAGPAAAAQEFQAQEAEAVAAAAAAALRARDPAEEDGSAGGGDENRPLTGVKPKAGSPVGGGTQAGGIGVPAETGAVLGERKANPTSAGQYMTAAGPLKMREEADPFSVDVGIIGKGDIVKVLETSDLWVRVAYRGREDGWVLSANKRGSILVPVDGNSDPAAAFRAQEASYAAAAAAATTPQGEGDDDRPLTGAKPGQGSGGGAPEPLARGVAGMGEDKVATRNGRKAAGGSDEPILAKPKPAVAGGDGGSSAEYMTALGPLKVRDEADPFSMDLGVTSTGDIVKVLETSDLWVRVSYHGRDNGWILTANKRGPVLVPAEGGGIDAAAATFAAQEAAFAETAAAVAAEPSGGGDDRPLTGAKPASVGATGAVPLPGGASVDERPGRGGNGAWVPPSEFPPEREEGLAAGGGAGGEPYPEKDEERPQTAGSEQGQAKYMTALGPLKVREDADPFSMDLGVLEKGHVVSVLERSDMWVRVSYRGREDGWVLTANKRGPTLAPMEADPAACAREFDIQEAAFAETAADAAAAEPSGDNRPLTGARPAALDMAEERPLSGGNGGGGGVDERLLRGGKGAWVPPSEFPPGREERLAEGNNGGGERASDGSAQQSGRGAGQSATAGGAEGGSGGGDEHAEFMTALGPLKVREEDDPFSMDLGVLESGHIVKVLETSGPWVRVSYRGREDGWVLTANKRGPTLAPMEADPAACAREFDIQEAAFAETAADAAAAEPSGDERPLTGARPAALDMAEERPLSGGSGGGGGGGGVDERPLRGGKGAWVPPSEFPPGHEEQQASASGKERETPAAALAAADETGGIELGLVASGEGEVEWPFLTALGVLKLREEADPFSMDLGIVHKGDLVKVLETSDKWVRVSYHGRDDGWVLMANTRGPTLSPAEGDLAANTLLFNEQEAAFVEAAAAEPSGDDRPLSGAKPVALAADDRPLTGARPAALSEGNGPQASGGEGDGGDDRPLAGGKAAWVPPSEFLPVHEEHRGGVGKTQPKVPPPADATSSAPAADGERTEGGEERFLTALGLLKLREEADPFSMDVGVLGQGDIVKVLETSDKWVRVCYHGQHNGWVLTANKRGPTLTPTTGDAVANALAFAEQEADFAEATAGAAAAQPSADDRPLTGTKPATFDEGDRPLAGAKPAAFDQGDRPFSGAKPADSDEGGGPSADGGGSDSGGDAVADVVANKASVPGDGDAAFPRFMTSLGPIKIRDEADACSMDLGVVAKGDIVKVLEMSGLWARVSYRSNSNGWVLIANRRGTMLTPAEDEGSAEAAWSEQELQVSSASNDNADCGQDGVPPSDPSDRPIGGARNRRPLAPAIEAARVKGDDVALADGSGGDAASGEGNPWQRKTVSARATANAKSAEASTGDETGDGIMMEGSFSAAPLKPQQKKREAVAAAAAKAPAGDAGGGKNGGLGEDVDSVVEVAAGKPWQKARTPAAVAAATAEGEVEDHARVAEDADEVAEPAKPWRAEGKARFMQSGADEPLKPWQMNKRSGAVEDTSDDKVLVGNWSSEGSGVVVEAQAKAEVPEREGDAGGSVEALEAALDDRDWKKRVAAFEGAARACRSKDNAAVRVVGPLLPRMLLDKNIQAVDAAVETLMAYLPTRSAMGADEGSAICSALAERALCCGRGAVESRGDEAARALLNGEAGALASRGAWLTLAARAGGLENEYFPCAIEEEGGSGASKKGGAAAAAAAAAAPRAVAGCVRALCVAIKWGAGRGGKGSEVVAGGGHCRKEVYAAAASLLASSKLPIKMAGVSLAMSLYGAEGAAAKEGLGFDDMEMRIQSQVERAFADADANAKAQANASSSPIPDNPELRAAPIQPPPPPSPTSPPIRRNWQNDRGVGVGAGGDNHGDDDDTNGSTLELLTPPPAAPAVARTSQAERQACSLSESSVDEKAISSRALHTGNHGGVDDGSGERGGGGATKAFAAAVSHVEDGLAAVEDAVERKGRPLEMRAECPAAEAREGGNADPPTTAEDDELNRVDDDDRLVAKLPDLRLVDSTGDCNRNETDAKATLNSIRARLASGRPALASHRRMSLHVRRPSSDEFDVPASTLASPRYWEKASRRTAFDSDTTFLATQMLYHDGDENNMWDDILKDMLKKAPPLSPGSRRRRRFSSLDLRTPRRVGAGGWPTPSYFSARHQGLSQRAAEHQRDRGGDDDSRQGLRSGMPPPSPRPISASPPAVDLCQDWAGQGDAVRDVSRGGGAGNGWFDSYSGMRGRTSSDAGESDAGYYSSADQPYLPLRDNRNANAVRPTHVPPSRSLVVRSTEELPRELAAKERAAPTAGRRRLLRGPGSWSSGVGVRTGADGGRSRSPTGFVRGGAVGGGSVGSPTSSLSMLDVISASMEAVAGVASINSAPPTEENRAIRRRTMSRRLSRGIGRAAASSLLQEASAIGEEAATAAAAEAAAEATAMGASPAAARAAAEAAIEEKILEKREATVEARSPGLVRRGTVGGWMEEAGSGVAARVGEGERSPRLSSRETGRRMTSFTPQREEKFDSPGFGNDSDAAYDTLRGVLGKVHLGKYFAVFRKREVRMDELKLLTEDDLKEMGLPVGARKRLLKEVHGYLSPTASTMVENFRVPSPLASPSASLFFDQAQEEPRRVSVSPARGHSAIAPTARALFSPRGSHGGVLGSRTGLATVSSSTIAGSRSPRGGLNLQAFASAPSVSSLRASLRSEPPPPSPTHSSSPPPSSLRRRATMSGAARGNTRGRGAVVDGSERVESGVEGGNDDDGVPRAVAGNGETVASTRRSSRSPSSSPRAAGTSGVWNSTGWQQRRENRATIGGGSDSSSASLEARRARGAAARAAAATAVNSAEATALAAAAAEASAVKGLQQRRASGIPRNAPDLGGSRLAAPGSRIRRSGSTLGGTGSASAAAAAAAADRDSGIGVGQPAEPVVDDDVTSGDLAAAAALKQGGAGALGGGRRSFIPRPSPKASRSSIPRVGGGRA